MDAPAMILRLLRHGGAVHLLDQARNSQLPMSEVRAELISSRVAVALDDDRDGWVVSSTTSIEARVPQLAHAVVDVAGSLDAGSFRSAWNRRRKLRGFVPVPERDDTLLAWFRRYREFVVQGDAVRVRTPGLIGLDDAATRITEALRGERAGLSRAELRSRCLDAGMAVGTFATALTYSPFVAPTKRDRWTLVGHPIDGAAPAPSVARRRVKAVSYTWSTEGRLVLKGVMNSPENAVMHVPTAVAHLLDGRSFDGRAEGGTPLTVTAKRGSIWGFGPAMPQMSSPIEVELRFDLSRRMVDVLTGGSDA